MFVVTPVESVEVFVGLRRIWVKGVAYWRRFEVLVGYLLSQDTD